MEEFGDFDRMLDFHQLRFMLGSTKPDDFVGDTIDVLFQSYPSELDSTGVNGDAHDKVDRPDTPKVFRDLPDSGRRSPRSRLFCSMIQSGILPDVCKLEMAEVCQSYEPSHSACIPCPFVDDEPLSDAQEAESLSEMLELVGDDYVDVNTGQTKVSYGQMCDMLRDQGASRALRELFQVEETDVVDSYAHKICWDPSVFEPLRATIAQHFAAGESSTSIALHAAISDIEDKYLAEEEEDEAASALSCSQERLADEIRRFVGQLHS